MINIDSKKYISDNVISRGEIATVLEKYRKEGKKIGLCTGSFDLLHPGHISHLRSAKKLCDVLVVGVALDEFSSKKRPDKGRPVFSHNIRAFMISQLKSVDIVIMDDGGYDILYLVKPDVYIKGSDFKENPTASHLETKKIIEGWGNKVGYTDDEKLSTTDILRHIKRELEIN